MTRYEDDNVRIYKTVPFSLPAGFAGPAATAAEAAKDAEANDAAAAEAKEGPAQAAAAVRAGWRGDVNYSSRTKVSLWHPKPFFCLFCFVFFRNFVRVFFFFISLRSCVGARTAGSILTLFPRTAKETTAASSCSGRTTSWPSQTRTPKILGR